MSLPEGYIVDEEHLPVVRSTYGLFQSAMLLLRVDRTAFMAVYTSIGNFARSLSQKFGREKAQEYVLFHVIIGSTPPGRLPYVDFPGEDSIATFLAGICGTQQKEFVHDATV